MTNQLLIAMLLSSSLFFCAAVTNSQSSTEEASDDASKTDLIYAAKTTDGCAIFHFNPKASESIALASVPDCSGALYVSHISETIFYVLNRNLYYVGLGVKDARLHLLSMPDDNFDSHRAVLGMERSYESLRTIRENRLRPFWAGRLVDGRIAVAMSISLPADDYLAFLFVRNSNEWSIEDQRHCGSWEFPCIFEKFEAEQTEWHKRNDERDIWSVDSKKNAYLALAEFEQIEGEYGSTFAERKLWFDVNRASVFVKARGGYSQHGMGIYTYTTRIEFGGPEGITLDISSCDVSFFGQYLLVHPCRSPYGGQVYDMETGEVVIDLLTRFRWLNK